MEATIPAGFQLLLCLSFTAVTSQTHSKGKNPWESGVCFWPHADKSPLVCLFHHPKPSGHHTWGCPGVILNPNSPRGCLGWDGGSGIGPLEQLLAQECSFKREKKWIYMRGQILPSWLSSAVCGFCCVSKKKTNKLCCLFQGGRIA